MAKIIFEEVKDQLTELIKKHQHKVDYLEIRLEEKEKEFIDIEKEGLQNIGSLNRVGGCVRTCYKGGWGFASFASLDRMEEMLEKASDISKLIGNDRTHLAEVEPVVDRVKANITCDPRDVPLQEKLQLLNAYIDRIQAYPSERIQSCGANYTEEFVQKIFFNSEGSMIQQEFMAMDLMLKAISFHAGEQTPMFEIMNNTHDFNFFRNRENVIEQICERAHLFSDAITPKGGEYPVILDAHMAGTFAHESFGHTSEADLFASSPGGAEILKLGKRFGGEMLNIYDTGDMLEYAGNLVYDDEGVVAERTDLLRDGILVGRMHSRATAAQFAEKPTGNARAVSYQYPPIVRMRNTCIAIGKNTFEELLSDIKVGVYAQGLYGGHGGENFSFIPARGYMIRDGKLAEPVKNFSLSGNLFASLMEINGVTGAQDFKTLAASGDNGGCGKFEQFPLSVGMSAPQIRFRKMNVGGC
ncbi:TldD/PmbA family protein [Candidatus Riflebacteria bacterium]